MFLANVGPIALQAAAQAGQPRPPKTKQPATEKRRPRRVATPPAVSEPIPPAPPAELPAMAQDEAIVIEDVTVEAEIPAYSEEFRMVPQSGEATPATDVATPEQSDSDAAGTVQGQRPRRSLVGKMRDWLRRAA